MSVLVTGAAGGIGSATVERFAAGGHEVVAHDLRAPDGEQASAGVSWLAGDLLDAEHRDDLARALSDAALEAVVVTHGIAGNDALRDLDEQRVRSVLAVNFLSVERLLTAVQPALRRGRGAFVVVSSQAGLQGEANGTAYCAAKFALVGWGRALAERLAREGVRVRVLCPGPTDTPLLRKALSDLAALEGIDAETYTQRRSREVPVGRLARPSEMAAAAFMLAGLGTTRPVLAAITGGELLR